LTWLFQVSGDDVAKYIWSVETAVEEFAGLGLDSSSWKGIGMLSLTVSNLEAALALQEQHPDLVLGTFDARDSIYEPLADGRLKFGIDQQALLQGIMPVYLLAYAASSQQGIVSGVVETGPHMIDAPLTVGQQLCETNHFNVCLEIQDEEMNLLPTWVVAIGYFMVGVTFFISSVCVAWTFFYWTKSELVRVSQPKFLLTLVAGVVISTLSIFFMAVETEYPTIKSTSTGMLTNETNPDIDRVNASCMAVPWLQSLGGAIVFASLFSKIWMIQKLYRAGERCRRVRVGLMDVLPYATVLMAVVLGLLVAWQIYDPFVWVRTTVMENEDGMPLESVGECTSEDGWYFWLALLGFHLLYLMYALVLCWRTKDIPGDFSEGNYISLCVFCIFQVAALSMPIAAMVRDNSTAFYFVRACAVFLQNFIVLALIFGPKMWRVFLKTDQLSLGRSQRLSGQGSSNLLRLGGSSELQVRFSDDVKEAEIKALQEELEASRNFREKCPSDNSDVKSMTEELEKLRRDGEQASRDYESTVQELRRSMEEMEKEMAALKSHVDDHDELTPLRKENAQLKSQIAELRGATIRMV